MASGAGTTVILMPSWVGDVAMATPALRGVRAGRPHARLVALVRPGLEHLLEGLDTVDEVVVHPMKGAFGPLRAGRLIRAMRASSALLLPNSFRSAAAAVMGRSPERVGYATDGRRLLLTRAVTPPGRRLPVPAVDWYADLVEAWLDVTITDRRPLLAVTADERRRAGSILARTRGDFALLNPGANRVDKRWPAERYARVGEHLHRAHGLTVVISGSPGERDLLEEVRRHSRIEMVDAAQDGLDLGALKAVVAAARLLVTNDTGPRHLAAALGTPAVCLFGPTDHRWTTLPVTRQRLLLAEPFLPEALVADRHRRHCAIDRITVGDACAAADALLAMDASRAPATPAEPRS